MQVPESDVVDAVEHARGHAVDTAHADVLLALARCAAADERVRDHDAPDTGTATEVGADPVECGTDDGLVRARERRVGIGRERMAHHVRREVGHPVDGDRAVVVVQEDRLVQPLDLGEDPDPFRHHAGAEAEAHGGVVVAGRHDDGGEGAQSLQHAGQHADGRYGWDRPVVDVARDDDQVHRVLLHEIDEVVQEGRLVVEQVRAEQCPPEVPVPRVQDPHVPPPPLRPERPDQVTVAGTADIAGCAGVWARGHGAGQGHRAPRGSGRISGRRSRAR